MELSPMTMSVTIATAKAKLLEFIQERFAHPILQAPLGASCPCTLVTNQDNMVVGYAVGDLKYARDPARFEGELTHYFSDRHWADPVVQGIKPFSPRSTDRTKLSLELTARGDVTVTVTPLSRDKDNPPCAIQILGCEGNVIYGIGNGIGAQAPTAIYLISVSAPLALPD
jgi:hypothetical protein